MFVLGGLRHLPRAGADRHRRPDTYFIVAHIHYVPFGGSVFTIFAGIYYWFPKMTGRMYNERLGKLHLWLTFIGFNGTFFPMHWVGLGRMPRRVADYDAQFGDWNMVISIFSFMLGASTLIFFYNVVVSWTAVHGRRRTLGGTSSRSSGRSARRRRSSTSTRSRRSSAARTSTASRGPHAVLNGGAHDELPDRTREEETVR